MKCNGLKVVERNHGCLVGKIFTKHEDWRDAEC